MRKGPVSLLLGLLLAGSPVMHADATAVSVASLATPVSLSSQPSTNGDAADPGLTNPRGSAASPPPLAGMTEIEKVFSGSPSLQVLRNLKQFGYNVFSEEGGSFAPVDNVPVDPNYVLGVGDELILHIWGNIVQQTINLNVDREGNISLPKQGPVQVRGLDLESASAVIEDAVKHHYANCNVGVTLGKLRAVEVFVLGEVERPGKYELNALSTVIHALYASGGPTAMGTLRDIRLQRNGQASRSLDLYDFLLRGEGDNDARLQSGDTIFIPRIGPVVGIAGFVKAPAIYELRGDLRISDLFGLAGGLTPASNTRRLQLERTSPEGRRTVRDLELGDPDSFLGSEDDILLQDGDLVSIFPINFNRHGYVTLSGNVEWPGQYEVRPGMRVSDLVRLGGGLARGTYLPRADLVRYYDANTTEVVPVELAHVRAGDSAADLELREWDQLRIYAESEVLPPRSVEISGAVEQPGRYTLRPGSTLENIIFEAGNLKPNAHLASVELHRLGQEDGEAAQVLELNLSGPRSGTDSDWLLPLVHGDHIFIRHRKDTTERQVVEVRGEVLFPGPYMVREGETLGQVLLRAGGLTDEAHLPGLVFSRASVRALQEQQIDQFQKLQGEALLRAQVAYHEGETRNGSMRVQDGQDNELTFRRGMLDMVNALKPSGRVVVDAYDMKVFPGSSSDPELQDGDVIHVPRKPVSVAVVGQVIRPQNVLHQVAVRARDYIESCGGPTRYADKKGVHVIRANGVVERGDRLFVEAGDTIVVPEDFKIRRYPGALAIDLLNGFYDLAVGAAIINSID